MSIFSLLFSWICFYTNTRHRLYITETLQKLYAWRKPIRPYAFIRVHNEIKTIDACLKSILPVVEGGVIVAQMVPKSTFWLFAKNTNSLLP